MLTIILISIVAVTALVLRLMHSRRESFNGANNQDTAFQAALAAEQSALAATQSALVAKHAAMNGGVVSQPLVPPQAPGSMPMMPMVQLPPQSPGPLAIPGMDNTMLPGINKTPDLSITSQNPVQGNLGPNVIPQQFYNPQQMAEINKLKPTISTCQKYYGPKMNQI
jgi:hypothetical protein